MLSSSPIGAKSIVFLLGLLYLHVHSSNAVISTSAGFPQDVFAKPAFQISFGHIGDTASALPIRHSDAIKILEQQEVSSFSSSPSSSSPSSSQVKSPQSTDISSLAVADRTSPRATGSNDDAPRTLFWSLQRSSPDQFQLCSVPDFTSTPAARHASSQRASSIATSLRSRQELIRSAQALLNPLKKVCLYHTTDWFTYSFCHGREIRQFRRLGPQTAAHKAFKAAGGGEAGKKAAIEAAEKLNRLQHPVDDPDYPAYILGRWTRQNEVIVGDDQSRPSRQQQPLDTDTAQDDATTGVAVSSNRGMPSVINSAGLDLVEEVQFGDWDEEELFAAETKALAHFKDSSNNHAIEATRTSASASGHESQRHRFLTQRWTNGTMCDINRQPRSVEVQFHCSNRKPLEDRIVMFKETTICNYVLIIETPRLCADPAFGSEKEEVPLPILCHQVVQDSYSGPTAGDPDKVARPPMSEVQGGVASFASNKAASDASTNRNEATASNAERAEQPATTSHTYGDPSRFGSVHDDYYDEAVGGPGAMYQQFHHDHHHDHDLLPHHDHLYDSHQLLHDHGDDDADIVVEIGLDEEGKLVVEQVSNQPAEASKEVRRRESGKKRNADDEPDIHSEQPMEIQLDIVDLLSALRGDDVEGLEKKLADKISEMLNKQMQQQHDTSSLSAEPEGDEEEVSTESNTKGKASSASGQMPDDLARLYERLMSAVTSDSVAARRKQASKAKGQQQPPLSALRMEKVGDSLSERVKRFYDARERQGSDDKAKRERDDAPQAPALKAHREL